MKRLIVNGKPTPTRQANAVSTGYNLALAVTYGTVESNNDNGTCNVKLVTGFLATKIKIPSKNYPSKDPVTGGVDYPPIGAYVKIKHPIGDLNSGWIEPAELDYTDENVKDALPGGTIIFPGGWTRTYDQEKGIYTISNGTFVLNIDPEAETFSLTDFKGNTIKNTGTSIFINDNLEVLQ